VSKKGNEEVRLISAFHFSLFSLNKRNFNETFGHIIQTRFVLDVRQLPEFVNAFLIALRIRYQQIKAYVELFRRLKVSFVPRLLDEILSELRRNLSIGEPYPREVPSLVFLSKLLAGGLMSRKELLCWIRRFDGKLFAVKRILFCFFAPEIEADAELSQTFSAVVAKTESAHWFDSIGHFFERHRANAWTEVVSRRTLEVQDEVLQHIQRDDIDYIKSAFQARDVVDARLQEDIFDPCVLLHSGPTLPMYAAAYGAVKCFQYFWTLGANVSCRDVKYLPVSHFAVTGNSTAILRFLFQNRIGMAGALQIAAQFHRNDLFKHIMKRQKWNVVEVEDQWGKLPITCAAAANNIELLCYLIAGGVDVNTAEGFGFSALHAAARAGQCQAIELLVKVKGINPNIQDIWGTTPLHVAVDSNQVRAVALLLRRRKVDVNTKDGNGKTAFYIAARGGHSKIARLFLEHSDVKFNELSKKGNSAMHAAVMSGSLKMVKLLLDSGLVRKDSRNMKGLTPAELAVELGFEDALVEFIARAKQC
jgi:ankyrin repeat protein